MTTDSIISKVWGFCPRMIVSMLERIAQPQKSSVMP